MSFFVGEGGKYRDGEKPERASKKDRKNSLEIGLFKSTTVSKAQDERFMKEALKEAHAAYKKKEVPVGAVLVLEGKIIARGHNSVEILKDATAHAEILCLTAGASALQNWRLLDTTLYCTFEPCVMCAGALFLSRVKRLVWGAADLRHGANGSFCDLFALKHPTHQVEVTSGILSQECAAIVQDFFRKRRKEP